MLRSAFVVRVLLVWVPVMAHQAWCQTSSGQQNTQNPPQQQQQQPPANPNNPTDPNANLPDPTKDPTKDPANDITKDPTKDPDATPANSLGNDTSNIAPEAPDYTGPAILSRGFALSRPAIPVNERFRIFAGINATYDSGLIGAYVQDGIVPSINTEGADFNWGASMTHYRRKDIFEFNYQGHYYDYYNGSKYSGQDHALTAGYTHQISPRLTFGIRETAGLYSNTYSVLNSTAIADTSLASSTIVVAPNTEAFDDRTYYATTSGSVTYRMSARLSFSFNGAYFLVNRDSVDLANTRGYQTGANIAYRITRRQTIGAYYNHSEYSYTKIFGDSNADSVGFNYSVNLTKTLDLAFGVGGTRYDSQTLAFVVPNPLVQEVLGITEGIEKYYFIGYAPDLSMTVTRRLRTSSIGASFVEGITPGNGLVLTSKRQSESAFWNLPTFRKYAMQVGGGRDVLSGYTSGPGNYASYYLRFSVTRPVTRVISSFLGFDYRQYGFSNTSFHQQEYRISLGLRFSPGDGPIKFW